MKIRKCSTTFSAIAVLILISSCHYSLAKPGKDPNAQGQGNGKSQGQGQGQSGGQTFLQNDSPLENVGQDKKAEKLAAKEEKLAAKEEKAALKEEKLAAKEDKAGVNEEKAALKEDKAAAKEEKAALKEDKAAVKEEKAALKEEKLAAKAEKDNNRQEGRIYLPGSSGGLTLSQCLAVVDQCHILEVLESELKPSWERTELAKEVKKIYKQRVDELKKLKKNIVELIDFTIANPTIDITVNFGQCDPQNDPPADPNGNNRGSGTTPSPPGSFTRDPGTKTSSPNFPGSVTILPPRFPSSNTTPDPWINPAVTTVSGGSGPQTAQPFNPNPNPTPKPGDPWTQSPSGPNGPGTQSPSGPNGPGTQFPPNPNNPVTSRPGDPWTQSPLGPNDPWTPRPGDPWTQSPPRPGDPWTQSPTDPWLNRCTVCSWSEWSAPYGFGQQERVRVVVQPGTVCPEAGSLREVRNITCTTNEQGEYVMDQVKTVTHNFHQDFVRPSEGEPRDLLLVLDSSGSISDDEFEAMKEGVNLLIDNLCGGFGPNPNQHRLAIVQFSTHTRTVHSFSDDQTPSALKAAVDSANPLYGVTCTGEALKLAFNEFDASRGARNYTVHDTLIITDGQSNCREDIQTLSKNLQARTQIYALAIGLSGNPAATSEVTSLVTDQRARHLFSLASFSRFKDMVTSLQNRQDPTTCQPISPPVV